MFCAPELIFSGTEGVGSRFHVLRSQTHIRRDRGRRVQFTCFVLLNPFSAVPTALSPVFMYCAPGLIFGSTDGVGSRFHFLRSRTHFRLYRRRRVSLSCFALPDSYSVVSRVLGPVFMFYAPESIFSGTEGVGSRFHVLRSRIHFRRYLGCQVRFLFLRSRLIFDGTEGVGSHFQVLRSRTHFWRYRKRRVPLSCYHVLRSRTHFRRYGRSRVPLSCFALPDSFSAVRTASGPVIMFCAPGLIFSGTEGVGSRTRFQRYRGRLVLF
jgi:hypothetical protein